MNETTRPFSIQGLDHVVLRIADLEKSLHFYEELLGCPVEKRQENIGLIQLRAGTALIDLVPIDGKLGAMGGAAPGDEGRNIDHFCLQVESFDEARILEWCRRHGIKVIGEVGTRYGALGAGPSVYIEDPDGNQVELKGPPDAS